MGDANTELQVGVGVVRNDLTTIKRMLEAMTEILRDNLVTLSGHDKASSDWRVALLSTVETVSGRIRSVEAELASISRFNEDSEEFQRRLAASMEIVTTERETLLQFLGLSSCPAPSPLARDLREMLEHLRDLNGKDPFTGEPKRGLDSWYERLVRVFELAVAGGILALLYRWLLPHLTFARF